MRRSDRACCGRSREARVAERGRLLLRPVRRLSLLLGMMISDVVLVAALTLPVVALGSLWGPAFTGFPYAIALKT